jgi:hypothetical protein
MRGKSVFLFGAVVCLLALVVSHVRTLDERNGLSGGTIAVFTFVVPGLMWPLFLFRDYFLPYEVEAFVVRSMLLPRVVPSGVLNASVLPPKPDYSLRSSWGARGTLDGKHGGSIVPPTQAGRAGLDPENEDGAKVDCFYLHPTTIYTGGGDGRYNVDVADKVGRYIFFDGMLATQGSAFNHVCRIFAPFYREMIGAAYFSGAVRNDAMQVAYSDVKRAFEHYLTAWGNGRPIVLAAHSQGTEHAVRLLQDFFDPSTPSGKQLLDRLVVAYLPGMQIFDTPWRRLAEETAGRGRQGAPATSNGWDAGLIGLCLEPDSTHCIVSWNTVSFDARHEELFYLQPATTALRLGEWDQSTLTEPRPVCTNPLSWKTASPGSPAAAECVEPTENEGSYFLLQLRQSVSYLVGERPTYNRINHMRPLPLARNVVGACCKDGYNRIQHPGLAWEYFLFPIWSAFSFPGGNYHSYDFAFYYASIRRNVKERVAAYFSAR